MSPSAVVDDSERVVWMPEPGGKSLPDTSTPDEKEPSARPTGRSAPPVTSKDTSKDTPPPVNKDNASSPNQPYSSGLQHMVGTGWSAMARIVREVDEQKIQGYKEDIDSILVFAGLFSAVMTAFSRSHPDAFLHLQRSIPELYRTPIRPNLPDFQPTVNAIRVNVLWFASLTLSLVSASFSILVKQWLRDT
ncbi:hypothetical protein BC629DRAFT_1174780 [Irpex lacteus]|nr:hypothetical protein BC629DRAFT_1174780 [Irpex lacteus]